MTTQDDLYITRLTDRQFEITKQELNLLDGRVIHLEGLQYRLRQFSVALWSLSLTVGFGVTKLAGADVRLIAASLCVPLVFGFMDAWYARAAQRFRTRIVDIAEYFNSSANETHARTLYLLDLMASQKRADDPRARYRESLLTKLTRTVRVTFFGFQLIVSAALLVVFVLSGYASRWYFLMAIIVVSGLVALVLASILAKKRWLSKYPEIPPCEFAKRTEQPFVDRLQQNANVRVK